MQSFSNIGGTIGGLAVTTVLSLAAMPTTASAADGPRFLVFGDAPYGKTQSDILEDSVAPAIENAASSFLIHVGDFKAGWEPCDTELIEARYDQLMALHPKAVFYTPGDNEWTDCDRPKLEPALPELDRLDHLRRLILSNPVTLPAGWHYATQQNFPENARWTQGKVMFATVHIVGTNNGRAYISLNDEKEALDLVDARDEANRAWLRAAFNEARKSNSGAVVIATHADVTDVAARVPCSDSVRTGCDAFAEFRDELLRHAAGFDGPVLLIHGDTNPFCLDKKFGGKKAGKLWRLNALGDGPPVNATDITVQFNDQENPFVIMPLEAGTSVAKKCS